MSMGDYYPICAPRGRGRGQWGAALVEIIETIWEWAARRKKREKGRFFELVTLSGFGGDSETWQGDSSRGDSRVTSTWPTQRWPNVRFVLFNARDETITANTLPSFSEEYPLQMIHYLFGWTTTEEIRKLIEIFKF